MANTVISDQPFLLESGTSSNSNSDGEQSQSSPSFWTYDTMSINHHRGDSEYWLSSLANVIDKYLIWCEGYETLWDEPRKQREEEQTNYGALLQKMNHKIRNLIDGIFTINNNNASSYVPPTRKFDNDGRTLGDSPEEIQDILQRRHQIPDDLKLYRDEMVFGYGRSPTSLRQYLTEEIKFKLGRTPEERRQARKHTNSSSQFAMMQRKREYMQIVEDVTRDGNLYLNTLSDLVSQWHNIIVDFHTILNQHYVKYLQDHPLPIPTQFPRQRMDILDMKDPSHFAILSDYDAFHDKYTKQAIPVILDNVNMTNHKYTLEYLTEQCGAMDVTDSIRVSNPVGQKSSGGWGGLKGFVLPDELLKKKNF